MESLLPELWVVNLLVHHHGLEHGTFSDHELNHSVNQTQQISANAINVKTNGKFKSQQ
jgi:hypothetical protein